MRSPRGDNLNSAASATSTELQGLLAELTRSASDAIITTDQQGRILEFNPAAEVLFECSAIDARDRNISSFLRSATGESKSVRTGAFEKLVAAIDPMVAVRVTGESFHCRWTYSKTTYAGKPRFTFLLSERNPRQEFVENAVATRTADLQSTVKALEVARGRFERAQAVANFGDAEIDLDTGERVCSAELCRLLGFDPVRGAPSFEQSLGRVHADDLSHVRELVTKAKSGRGWTIEDTRVVLPDGSLRWIRSTGENSRSPETGHRKINVVAYDVTALKTAERELVANLERERELVQLRTEFMNMVTHEYRTPLGIIMSSVEILERYFHRLSADERAAHLAEIGRGTRRLAALVEDVLFLGKAEAGRVSLELRPVDLKSVLDKLSSEVVKALGAERSIELKLDRQSQRAVLDQRLISHVITNLLSNALKYSTLDTEVHVRVRRRSDELEFKITDHGIGIPEPDIPKLFQFFQRASNVGTISGSGLGLAIVKRCVDLHGGNISLQSEVGRGTCVTVRLPQHLTKEPSS